MKIKSIVLSLLLVVAVMSGVCAQNIELLIKDDVAMFYPENFDAMSHLPSFALLEEPQVIGELPSEWKTKVEFYQSSNRSYAQVSVGENVDLYGTGEVTGELLRNGTTRTLYNTDNFVYERFHGLRLYQSHPWVLGVRDDGSAFGVLADNTWRQEISLGTEIVFSAESTPFRVFVIEKETPQEVVKELAELTGKMELPPLWSLGYQQCRWSYYPDTRVKEIADTFRIKKIPCDVIWMDIHYMDAYKVFTFSPDRFPNPTETNRYLHNKGFKSIWMIDPGVKYEEGYSVYDSGKELDVWIKTKDSVDFKGVVWPGECVFPDFTQTKTNKWWSGLYKDYMATGIDGVWNDMNEPAVFGTPTFTMPADNIHLGSEVLQKNMHLRYHNVYGMMMVKASREGILAANPKKRPFVLTRSNFLGGQRYAATWTGDNESSWEHLKMSIPMSLNLGLSGQPFNGPDIGGFEGNATPELFGHWIALGTFYPFSRGHSIEGSKPHEPWAFGEEIENVSRKAIERRYRLLPYLYTQFYESSKTGMPVMQPAFFADVRDLNLRGEDEAFLFGPDLFIVPKWADEVSMPKGDWKLISIIGEDSSKDQYLPDVMIRPGAIVPLGKVIQNTTQYSIKNLELMIYLDENNKALGKVYYDEGEGFKYKNGKYIYLTIEAVNKDNKVSIKVVDAEGKGSFDNVLTSIQVLLGDQIYKVKGNLMKGITFSVIDI
ncbi:MULTISPECIES: TIM-barrel domain-containing protein [unclassified Saccharicrinis]|uniref:TIM-barrel domain-containing protein n=1 Tax=unclassified Saccharicrinis TaxID=2646859 RepID=UPI003D328783